MGKRKLAPDDASTSPSPSGPTAHTTGGFGPSSHRQRPRADAGRSSKRARKDGPSQGSDAPSPEKRGAVFKKACPKNILDRVARVMSQRRREGDEPREEFKVLGSTGNVYTVTIGRLPSCNCPDASRGNHCKHILFVFLKVLQVPQSSGLWYQKALLTSELQSIFADAPQAPNALAHSKVREAYAHATGKAPALPAPTPSDSKRRSLGPEDCCPICYEGMDEISQAKLAFCEECGNALHTECFEQWRRRSVEVTCVWCRAKWPTSVKDGSGGTSRGSDGYINLGSVAGLSGARDTSSYHQSWRYEASRYRAGRA